MDNVIAIEPFSDMPNNKEKYELDVEYLEATLSVATDGISIIFTIGSKQGEPYVGWHTTDQLRKFGKWLIEKADKLENRRVTAVNVPLKANHNL